MNSTRYGKFFVGIFLLIAATAAFRWVLLRCVPYTYMDDEYPWWMQTKDYIQTKGERQEVLLMGDSRMKSGVLPSKLCENAYNIAVGGATPLEMYYSLKAYLQAHPKPERIIMGFGGFHYSSEEAFKTRCLYFHFLPLWEELESQLRGYRLGLFDFGKLRNEVTDTLKYELLFPQKYSAACINGKFKREEYNRLQYQNTVETRGHMFFGRNAESDAGLNGEAYSNAFVVNPRINYYLRRIIDLCKELDIPLYIEQLPMNEPSWQKINGSGYYAEFQSYFSTLAEETGIPVETEIPCYEPEFFGDPSHLNPRGAARFTAEIKAKYSL